MLTFDPVEHRYFWHGSPVPGVTSVLQAAGLLDFGGASPEAMAFGRERGRAVHTASELDDHGDLVEESVDPAIAGYLAGWRKFRAETGFVPDASEDQLYHPVYRYAGTRDRRGLLFKWLATVDLKTGAPQRATGPQTAAYAMADDPKHGHLMKRYAVHLDADGGYKLVEYKERNDFAVFCAALSIYNWKGPQ